MSELSSQPVAWQAFIDGKWHAVEDPVWCVQKGYKVRPLYAAPPAAVPEGWALIPREPTPEMIAAFLRETTYKDSFRAMLAAVPPPPTEGKERSQITVAAHDDAIAAIEFSLTIDDHFDRFEFLQAFLNGDVDSDEWDDWHAFLASRKAPPPGNTEGE